MKILGVKNLFKHYGSGENLVRAVDGIDLSVERGEDLVYDFREKSLVKDGVPIPLSKTEIKLLEVFIQNKNQVLTMEILLEKIWDNDGNFVDKNTLSVTVARLRAKIEEDRKHPIWIRNVFGIGYKWSDRDEK